MPFYKIGLIIFVSLVISACGPAKFKTHTAEVTNAIQSVPASVVCDPFDTINSASATSGLRGTLHYLQDTQPRESTSTALISNGKQLNVDLFLNSVFVPTREFTQGFVTEENTPLVDENGTVLTEWFGMDLYSKLKLGPNDSPGDYQVALLSDDGASLALQDANGQLETIIDNEGLHSTKMGCSTQIIPMSPSTRLPMNIKYFQGPRRHISIMMLWRKVDATTALNDPHCGRLGVEYFFTAETATSPAIERTPFKELLARGWKPVSAQNFELQSGTNRCSE